MKENLQLSGALVIILKDKNNKIKAKHHFKNLVVNSGIAYIFSRMESDLETPMSRIGFGLGSTPTLAAQTALESELGIRTEATSITANTNTITYSFNVTTQIEGSLTEAGIFNSVTNGTMLCRTTFPAINKVTSDQLDINWTITLSAV